MIQGGDLLGDGVNVAARLENLADPGGLCISEAAYGYVRKAVPITFTDLGPQRLKNIEEPVRAYAVNATSPASTEKNAALSRSLYPTGPPLPSCLLLT